MPDPLIEEYFRSEVNMAWDAVVAARGNPAAYAEAFQRYCQLLFESDAYGREGLLRGKASTAAMDRSG